MKYDKICYPKYETTMRKKQAEQIEWSYEKFCDIVRKNVNQESGGVFSDLGYRICFFSSKNNNKSASISLSIGNRNPKFVNSCIIEMPLDLEVFSNNESKNLADIFYECVKTFHPFWGCISNDQNARKYGRFLIDHKPSSVHWINYWSDSICKQIGMKRINEVIKYNDKISFHDNFFRIKDIPLDMNCEADMKLQTTINSMLRLEN